MKAINLKYLLYAASLVLAANVVQANEANNLKNEAAAERHYYYTGGTHNDKGCTPPKKCVYERTAGEPSDPAFPTYWTSEWTMYKVFNNYDKFPPPYSLPPAGLTSADYEVSYGATYYDSTYKPADGDGEGAMMEHYEKRCLPIFPIKNDFTCSFVSLGNKAYFLRYQDRPAGTPACCQFSLKNHPPRTDFIKHLPYNKEKSTHIGGTVQAYSMEVGPQKILFGYSFEATPRPDNFDKTATPYRHPQSFFFSGDPGTPPNAPIVSQNYTNFRMQRPDPRQTWDQVAQMCPANPEWCCLFDSDCPKKEDGTSNAAKPSHSWSTLNDKDKTQ